MSLNGSVSNELRPYKSLAISGLRPYERNARTHDHLGPVVDGGRAFTPSFVAGPYGHEQRIQCNQPCVNHGVVVGAERDQVVGLVRATLLSVDDVVKMNDGRETTEAAIVAVPLPCSGVAIAARSTGAADFLGAGYASAGHAAGYVPLRLTSRRRRERRATDGAMTNGAAVVGVGWPGHFTAVRVTALNPAILPAPRRTGGEGFQYVAISTLEKHPVLSLTANLWNAG